jgi:hypothetical protein
MMVDNGQVLFTFSSGAAGEEPGHGGSTDIPDDPTDIHRDQTHADEKRNRLPGIIKRFSKKINRAGPFRDKTAPAPCP